MAIDLMPGFGAFTPAAAAGSTWNPADKSGTITLSGGNLIATAGAGGSDGGQVRGTTSKSTGKWHFEIVCTTVGTGGGLGVGFANSSANLAATSYLGEDTNSVGYFSGQTNTVFNAANNGSAESYTTGDVITVEVDFDAEAYWVAKNAGNWNNNGSADPATGVSGQLFTAGTGPWFIALSVYTNAVGTLRTTSGSFTRAISSGFSAWG